MGKIQVLDGETINKIAAGEVVERPSSVVKELVENAIDAGATAVTIEIQDGGTSLIRITDNGSGMEKEDIAMAFLRHSTSKIRNSEDLQTIRSLGFRGEALSSISAVAQVELLTKTAHAMTGCRYRIDGGVERSLEDIGCPDGTTFIVRQLFYNTPARRKFLKSNMTEAGYINDLIARLSMSHPEVSFKFINNRQNRLHTSGNGRLKDILYHIYGRDISSNLLPVNVEQDGIRMTGFIGKPMICRGNRTYENYFINGRYIKSPVITQAIEDAYKTFTMVHKFPFAVLHFILDTAELDVNVHPTKMEVRFSHGQELYRFVYESLRRILLGRELIPEVKPAGPEKNPEIKRETPQKIPEMKREEAQKTPAMKFEEPQKIPEAGPLKAVKGGETPGPGRVAGQEKVPEQEKTPGQEKVAGQEKAPAREKFPEPFEKKRLESMRASVVREKPQQYELFETGLLTKEARLRHKLIGQVFETYWIVEYDGKLFIIDQHAAHEKVLYEKLMKRFKESRPMIQMLEPPIILTLSMGEADLLNQYMDDFKRMGFEFESFGGKEYALRGVPSDLYGFTGKEMVMELLDELSGEAPRMRTDMIGNRIATMACKAAVKGNMRISFKEADALIEELLQAENPYTCPHGRPTIISMTKTELEKKFKRIV
ncbi:DNA mismatch repair endonuclease MutL [Frisingicoccus sp.]|uniref:DNA mismatch repair endonuclease MutL n=1 Tax=Frisingicoccus sp. TaxID=1918627 RepID=UPI003AB21DA2